MWLDMWSAVLIRQRFGIASGPGGALDLNFSVAARTSGVKTRSSRVGMDSFVSSSSGIGSSKMSILLMFEKYCFSKFAFCKTSSTGDPFMVRGDEDVSDFLLYRSLVSLHQVLSPEAPAFTMTISWFNRFSFACFTSFFTQSF